MEWIDPELIYPPVDTDPNGVMDEALWNMPAKLGNALMEIWEEAAEERERTLDDIGWIMHELDGLG